MGRAPCCEKVGLKKGKWTQEEDEILVNYIKAHGEGSWRSLPKKAGLLRCGKSCRLRWINYLRTGIKRGNFSREEDELIIKLHASLGTRWSKIASQLHGRTDNEIKNYWNSHLSRSIHTYYHQVNMDRNTQLDSMTPSKSSPKSCNKNREEISQTPTNKIDRNSINPHNNNSNSLKCRNKKKVSTSPSEFSDRSDEEEVWNKDDDDGFNRPFSPRFLDDVEAWKLEPIKASSEYSTICDELSTSKDDNENGPCFSPGLSSIFREMEKLFDDKHTKHTKIVNGDDYNNVNHDLLFQKEQGMEEEGWLDSLWDLDLWSTIRFVENE